jgi:Domain of unknown function (DUF4150)/GHH signature containing HNH/Endo VII superfamily nuclease toxin  2
MGCEVYANGMTIACKVADGKTIAAMPDVCLSPPTPPAGPVPIPYPNTAMASDTTKGSKTVQIGGQEVMLKRKSTFKKSTGDEAATKTLGMGVVSHQIQGEVNFCAWSMDVKFEGENVPRNLDLTLHNEMCDPANTPPWPYMDSASLECSSNACVKSGDAKAVKDNCDGPPQECFTDKCCEARKCVLVPYSPNKCCPKGEGQKTPHHVVPKSQFKEKGAGGADLTGGKYNPDKAPCVCEDGTSHSTGKHGDIHEETNNLTVNHPSVVTHVVGKTISKDARWDASQAEGIGAEAVAKVTKCDKDCIEAQARNGHGGMKINPGDKIRPSTAGRVTQPPTNTTAMVE